MIMDIIGLLSCTQMINILLETENLGLSQSELS